jgi:hypothetical protein
MGQAFDDVHAVYCYFESGIILSGVCIQINNPISHKEKKQILTDPMKSILGIHHPLDSSFYD